MIFLVDRFLFIARVSIFVVERWVLAVFRGSLYVSIV